jgi:hypothetical protein
MLSGVEGSLDIRNGSEVQRIVRDVSTSLNMTKLQIASPVLLFLERFE